MAQPFGPSVTVDTLRALPIFAPLPEPAVAELLREGQVGRLARHQRLSSLARPAGERYCFVLSGVVSIALDREGTSVPASRSSERSHEYIGHFSPGEVFSDGFLDRPPGVGEAVIDCVASSPATLLAATQLQMVGLMRRHQAWATALTRMMANTRDQFFAQQEPHRRLVQDFYLRHGFASSSQVRVSQLDLCLDCNKCEEACAKRHGFARGVRAKLRLGRLSLTQTCRNCVDRPCLSACSFGALALNADNELSISDRCKGCGACAHKCPNGAIFMGDVPFSLADFPEPIPASDAQGRTNVPGLSVAGDVAGAALIRLSINQAVRAVDLFVPRRLQRPGVQVLDLVVVGSGPAGLAAAQRCQERQLNYLVLEKRRSLSTIRDYPKDKFVMAEPANLPLASSLWFGDCTKEELLARWEAAIAQGGLRIREDAEVRRVAREPDGIFRIEVAEGCYYAEGVLVCVGLQGSPRRLEVPGEEPERVHYRLSDPDEFAGKHVLVVGGGDSALEAALALADVPGTSVTLSYRQAAFTRAKPANRESLQSYQQRGRIRVVLNSRVRDLQPGLVRLSLPGSDLTLDNDVVFALLGADPPTAFLQDAGIQVLQPGSQEMASYAAQRGTHQRAVKCDHCAGYAHRACFRACPTGALLEFSPQELFTEISPGTNGSVRNFSAVAFLEGVAEHRARQKPKTAQGLLSLLLFLSLAFIGIECFLRRTMPEHSFQARLQTWLGVAEPISYTSGKGFGHWLGYVGTSFMLLSLAYPLHTRLGMLKNLGAQSTWLKLHLWAGFIGATLVTYHAAFKLDRWVGLSSMSMWVVVASGVVGRYLYGMVHSGAGYSQFKVESMTLDNAALVRQGKRSRAVNVLSRDSAGTGKSRAFLMVMLWHQFRDFMAVFWLRWFGLSDVSDRVTRRRILRFLSDRAALRRNRDYLESARRTLRYWNWVHVLLAITMFAIAGVHIAYGFMYKAV
jgi:thioredoxin reductase (NADPH)